MAENKEVLTQLNGVMTKALLEMKVLVDNDIIQRREFVSMVKVFLQGLIATAADLSELSWQGSGSYLYSEIEAGAKASGLSIEKITTQKGFFSYSIANIESDDITTAMNYLGQALSITLFKNMQELPLLLRTPEMLLRGIEALMTNLLQQKFFNPHQALDQFCDHVHMALKELARSDQYVATDKSQNIH